MAALGASRVWTGAEHAGNAWGYALFFSWLVTPVVMVVAVSLVKPIFVPRFLIFCLPALLLLVAVGICRLRPAALSVGLIVAISICSLIADFRFYQYDFDMRRQDWRAVTSYVFDHAQPGDSIFFYPSAGEAPFNYYVGQQKSASLRPKTLHANWLKYGTGQNPFDPNPKDWVAVPGTNLWATLPLGSRVWFVVMSLSGSREEYIGADMVDKWLSDGRQEVDAQDFTPLRVLLFDRTASGSTPGGNRTPIEWPKID